MSRETGGTSSRSTQPPPSELLLFLPSYGGGGSEHVMITVANGLAVQGIDTSVAICNPDGPMREKLHPRVKEILLGVPRVGRAAWPLAQVLRDRPEAALFSSMNYSNVMAVTAAMLARFRGRVVLREATTVGAIPPERIGHRQRLVNRLGVQATRRADVVIAGSAGVATDLSLRGVDCSKVRVIGNPIDMGMIGEATDQPCGHPWLDQHDRPVILSMGRLGPEKGFDVLINAFSGGPRARGWRLMILGEGSERETLQRQISRLGLDESVALPGFVSPPFSWLAKSDLFVLSSRWEGMPNALIQAIACGCRVVSTNCRSGPAEILENGRWGALVPVDDVGALRDAMIASIDGEHPSRDILERARNFDLPTVLPAFADALGFSPHRRA